MHEMRKTDALQQHPHRAIDGRKEMYGVHKLADKDHHKSMGTSSSGRDHRSMKASQIPAGALRVCGEWSEHLSSNGKVYFFNNKTKSSQWERPKDWSNSRAIEVKKDKSKPNPNRVSSKHSIDGSSSSHHSVSRQHSKPGYSHSLDAKKLQAQQQHARHRTNHDGQSGNDFRDRDYRTSSSAKDRDYRDIDYRDARSGDSRLTNNIEISRSHQNQDRDYRSDSRQNLSRQSSETGRLSSTSGKDHNGKSISIPNNVHSSLLRSNTVSIKKDADGNLQYSKDDRPRSSRTTPKSAAELSQAARISTASDVVDGSVTNGNEETSALVQTLSSVLNQASKSTTDDGQDSSSLEGNLKNALQMLLTVAAQNQQISGTAEDASAEAGTEPPSKRTRPSNPSDEHINNSLAVCQSAEKVLGDLKGLFDEQNIAHVQGWPAEQMERQSVRLCDENHQFMVNHTSQLSAYMKVSRSRVRTAEINSTLQEQRILYLRQQVKDLEKSSTSVPFT